MQVKTFTNYIHIAPRKVRLVADLIRGLDVVEAEQQLLFSKKAAARVVLKSLKSATASAIHNFSLEKDNLYISKIKVDEGPSMKRWRPAAFGSAHPIIKKTSHITLVLDEKVKSKKKVKKEKKKPETKEAEKEIKKTQEVKKEKKWIERKEKEKIKRDTPSFGFVRKIFRRKSGT